MMDINVFFEVRDTAREHTDARPVRMRDRNGTRTHQQGAAIYTYETSSSLFPNLYFPASADSSLPDTSQASVGTSRNKTFFKLKCAGKKTKCVEAHREQHPRNPKHDDV